MSFSSNTDYLQAFSILYYRINSTLWRSLMQRVAIWWEQLDGGEQEEDSADFTEVS